jgi:hypothetical protein
VKNQRKTIVFLLLVNKFSKAGRNKSFILQVNSEKSKKKQAKE